MSSWPSVGLSCWQCSAPVSSASVSRSVTSTPFGFRVLVDGLDGLHAEDVVAAVDHEVGAAHVVEHPFQLEGLGLVDRLGHGLRPYHPFHVAGQGMILARGRRTASRCPRSPRARCRQPAGARATRRGRRSSRPCSSRSRRSAKHPRRRASPASRCTARPAPRSRSATRSPVPAQRPALPRPVDHEHRDAALHRAVAGHEPEFVLERIEAAEGDEDRLALAAATAT